MGKGFEFTQENRTEEAAKEFQAALALDPTLVRARYQLAVCYFVLHKWTEARKEFEQSDQQTGGEAHIVYYLARLDYMEGKVEAAIIRLKNIVSDPPFPDTAYYLGAAYLKKGNSELAEEWLKKAAGLTPNDFRVPDHLARVYLKLGRRTEADEQFRLSASLREHYDKGARQGVDCNQTLATRPLAEALTTCQQLFDPGDPDELLFLAIIYGNHELYKESLQPLKQAERLDPASFEVQHNLGLSFFRLGLYADARGPLENRVRTLADLGAAG